MSPLTLAPGQVWKHREQGLRVVERVQVLTFLDDTGAPCPPKPYAYFSGMRFWHDPNTDPAWEYVGRMERAA